MDSPVQYATALTRAGVHLSGQVGVNLHQKFKKLGALKQGMAHFNGLVLGRKRLSHKDRLFKVLVGDFFVSIMPALCESSIKGLARLVNLPLPKLGSGASGGLAEA